MGSKPFLFSILILFTELTWVVFCGNTELKALLDMKASLDPDEKYLSSWTINGGSDPCDGSFEGIACNNNGQVANISLQGKGLYGKISPSISGLKHLTGLYLHYNSLFGEIPREIANLTELTDLYLNVNNLSGDIPSEIGDMGGLQVLQLCYNQLTGSIPTQLGSLKKLSVLALQSNQLTGAIPASLGDLGLLMRLDLSFNHKSQRRTLCLSAKELEKFQLYIKAMLMAEKKTEILESISNIINISLAAIPLNLFAAPPRKTHC